MIGPIDSGKIDSERAIHVVIMVIVVVIVLLTFTEYADQMQAFGSWCHRHNGSVHFFEEMYCQLPNGTRVSSTEVLG